ncbi:hypothetical protein L1785_11920 [Antribacter sp. KLBMP9083]|uniref:Uncharacterized protein n=1 Tax=Antribacter soli TaxID=2910976 RepID=A0AA41QGJ3_9MICO|nr:hypothetical protein [Antribacter soli]MCF4121689.1 hypothetical protein [Antribacter soli]
MTTTGNDARSTSRDSTPHGATPDTPSPDGAPMPAGTPAAGDRGEHQTPSARRTRRLATAAAAGFGIIVAFQVALAAGAPLGAAAWSGAHPGRLPEELRVASSVSAVVWLLATLVVLARGGMGVRLPATAARVGVRLLVALLALGAVMNLASSSPWERYGWAPFSLVLLVLCVLLARRGPQDVARY